MCVCLSVCMFVSTTKSSHIHHLTPLIHTHTHTQSSPNPDDPLNNVVADLWKTNEDQALKNAREWTRLYAT